MIIVTTLGDRVGDVGADNTIDSCLSVKNKDWAQSEDVDCCDSISCGVERLGESGANLFVVWKADSSGCNRVVDGADIAFTN